MTDLYLEPGTASDVTGFRVASTSDSADPVSRLKMLSSQLYTHPDMLKEFITPSGTPGATGTYAKTVTAAMSCETDLLMSLFQVRVDLVRYQTTGNVASANATFLVDASFNQGDGLPGVISRVTAGSFIDDGFTAGTKITVTDSDGNDGTYLISSVDGGNLVLSNEIAMPDPGTYQDYNDDFELQNFLNKESSNFTITSKEEFLVTGSSDSFSEALVALDFTIGSFSATFASDDRIIVRVYGKRMSGNSKSYMGVLTQGEAPCIITLS